MKKYRPTATLLLDKRIAKKTGKYPLKLTIYCKPYKKRYSIGIDLTEEEWMKVKSGRLKNDDIRKLKVQINTVLLRAEEIIAEIQPFSFMSFEEKFFISSVNMESLELSTLFENYANQHMVNGNVGTAISYKTSLNSLQSFRKKMLLSDITPKVLEAYESFMRENGKSVSTIGIYLRQLRAVFNDTIQKKLINPEAYPFGKNKYKIPAARNIKKALTAEDIRKLLDYKAQNLDEEKAHDFWIFSYLSNGMNFCDIAKLTYNNIQGDFIYYIRSKTKNTKKENTQFVKVPIHPQAREVIMKWKTKEDLGYVFSILQDGLTPTAIKYRIQNFIKKTNKKMDKIRKQLGILQNCSTYTCRHSFATVLKRKNVSTEFISESLGHSSLHTTQVYLASFEDETKIQYSTLLTD